MNSLFNNIDITNLDKLWDNPVHKKYEDREYYSVTLVKSCEYYVTKLLIWFELNSGLLLKSYEKPLILHRFYEGNYFLKHNDSIYIHNNSRAYVVGFHLNNDYEGGEYVLHDKYHIINNYPGVPYYFNSSQEHEIIKVTKGIRKSALIFINHEDLIKTKLV